MKNKILRKVIFLFFVASLIAAAAVGVGSKVFNTQFSINRSSIIAQNAMELFKEYISMQDFPACLSDPEDYMEKRQALNLVCKAYDLRYMYVFSVNEQLNERTFYLITAGDEAEDARVQNEFYYGAKRENAVQEEIDVFLGRKESSFYMDDNEYGSVYVWYYPIKNEAGEIVAVLGLDYDVSEAERIIDHHVFRMMIPIFITYVIVSILLLLIFQREVFRPLKQLSVRMESYSPDTKFRSSEIRSIGEIRDICDSFEKMSDAIQNYLTENQKMTEEKLQSSVELDIARRIQYGMVPHDLSIADAYFAADAFAEAAREVGGDFYDYFTANGKVYAVIGDVSGKGIAAAMFMSMAKTTIREKLRAGNLPAEALNSANNDLCAQNPEGMFVTVFAAMLDTDTGELCYANAGHTYPVLLSEPCRLIHPEQGIILGLFEDSDITNEILMLKNNEGILLYTDGATEALDMQNRFFGEERLLASLAGSRENAAHTAADAVREFEKGREKSDDLTLLSLVFKDDGNIREAVLPPSLDALDEVKEALIERFGLTPLMRKIFLACEEIFVNIVEYSGTDTIRILYGERNGRLTIRFEDNGKAFDPIHAELPEKEFDELDSGGMGIALVRKIALEQEYKRISGRNILKLVFRIGPAAPRNPAAQ